MWNGPSPRPSPRAVAPEREWHGERAGVRGQPMFASALKLRTPLSLAPAQLSWHIGDCRISLSRTMATAQEQYDDAMFEFSRANYDAAIVQLLAILEQDPAHFEAQLALGM